MLIGRPIVFTESFDSHLPYDKVNEVGRSHVYAFEHNSNRFRVTIRHNRQNPEAVVNFQDKNGEMGKTGNHPHDAVKVFSTVHKIVKDHVAAHPHLTHVSFAALKSDGHSRASLYHRMAQKLGGNVDHQPDEAGSSYIVKVR